MARRGDEAQAEALKIVESIVEGVDLKLAPVARAGIDFADGEAAAEALPRHPIEARGKLGKRGIVLGGRRLGDRVSQQILEQQPAHDRP